MAQIRDISEKEMFNASSRIYELYDIVTLDGS